MIRLNATEIDAKSSDPRTSLTASARAIASTTSSLSGGQHRLHDVIGETANIAKIKLQPLAMNSQPTLRSSLSDEAALGLRALVLRQCIRE